MGNRGKRPYKNNLGDRGMVGLRHRYFLLLTLYRVGVTDSKVGLLIGDGVKNLSIDLRKISLG